MIDPARAMARTARNDDEALFKSQADCERLYSATECSQNELVAQQQHVATAPKFSSRTECEENVRIQSMRVDRALHPGVAGHSGPTAGQVSCP